MPIRFTPSGLLKLQTIGEAIDTDCSVHVLPSGELTLSDKEIKDERPRKWRSDRRAAASPQSARSDAAASFGRGRPQEGRTQELAGLGDRYWGATILEMDDGIWVVAPSEPLGSDGPSVTFAVAVPDDQTLLPKGWAFIKADGKYRPIGPRHTNFPHHDVCAYVPDDGTWSRGMPLYVLLNLYSGWAFRHFYLLNFGRWIGRQIGASALYRRREFQPDEWCGCDNPKRYKDCHMESDVAVPEEQARREHHRKLGPPDAQRIVPDVIAAFAQSNFRKAPSISTLYMSLGFYS